MTELTTRASSNCAAGPRDEAVRRPRVAMVAAAFPKLSETFLFNKFVGLLESGVDVHVVCGRSEEKEWRNYSGVANNKGLRSRVGQVWPHRPRWLAAVLWPIALLFTLAMRPAATWRYFRETWRKLGWRCLNTFYLDAPLIRLQPDIVHFEFGTLALERTHLREALPAKLVVSFRGFDLNFAGLENPHYYADVWRSVSGVHCLGEDLWRRAQRRGCPSDMPHALIPPAIDMERFRADENRAEPATISPERPLRILSVGRLHWNKGHEYALQAVHQLRAMGVSCEFRIAGDGDYFEPLSFAIHELQLSSIVVLLGALQQAQVRDQMLWADVFLHAAMSEGFCNSVLEAQSMQLPVVCSDAGGLGENVQDGVTGFVVPRRDPAALAAKLALLADDPSLRARMGRAGRQRVQELYRLDRQIEAFARWYDDLLGPARRVTSTDRELPPELALDTPEVVVRSNG